MSKVEHINEESYPPGFHPALPPPVSERGLIKWVRESLFNSWYNSIATIVGLYFLNILRHSEYFVRLYIFELVDIIFLTFNFFKSSDKFLPTNPDPPVIKHIELLFSIS